MTGKQKFPIYYECFFRIHQGPATPNPCDESIARFCQAYGKRPKLSQVLATRFIGQSLLLSSIWAFQTKGTCLLLQLLFVVIQTMGFPIQGNCHLTKIVHLGSPMSFVNQAIQPISHPNRISMRAINMDPGLPALPRDMSMVRQKVNRRHMWVSFFGGPPFRFRKTTILLIVVLLLFLFFFFLGGGPIPFWHTHFTLGVLRDKATSC